MLTDMDLHRYIFKMSTHVTQQAMQTGTREKIFTG